MLKFLLKIQEVVKALADAIPRFRRIEDKRSNCRVSPTVETQVSQNAQAI